MNSVEQFYNQLAQDYHTIFADWKGSVRRQGETLASLITSLCGEHPLIILDCTCGIGTQAIGLAQYPQFTVHATDLSPEAVTRAREEAEEFGVKLTFGVADVLNLESEVEGTFEVVLSCDNAIAHFLSDDDLKTALHNMKAKIAPGSLLLLSLRDYDQLLLQKPRATTPQVNDIADGRQISFQVWDWLGDGRQYTLNHFVVKAKKDGWETVCNTTRLRAWRQAEITLALKQTGFNDIMWHFPEKSGYYQPIVTARSNGVRGRG
jgi:glycine/sarcosine N-methyltransferase